jgi:nucleoside-diphosphate-sugar epimerase
LRALVTGGTGFAGNHLCRHLSQAGHQVRALVRHPDTATSLTQKGIELVPGDVRDTASLSSALTGVDIVYHLAAVFRRGDLSPRQMWEINAQGTRNMLRAAARARVRRFVHCSTVGVHGETGTGPASEESPYKPGDAYQRSKLEGERIAQSFMAEGHLPVVIFRPGGIYGPGDMRFLKLFRAIQTRRFAMLGSGEVLYQLIYIDDLIDGILLCGDRDEALGRVYILTGDEPVTLNRLVSIIAETLGVPLPRWRFPVTPVYLASALCEFLCRPLGIDPPLHRRRIDFFRKSRSFDIARAKGELGFRPRTDLRRGIELTAAWYREQGFLRSRRLEA